MFSKNLNLFYKTNSPSLSSIFNFQKKLSRFKFKYDFFKFLNFYVATLALGSRPRQGLAKV
jgi:hypothetical protein